MLDLFVVMCYVAAVDMEVKGPLCMRRPYAWSRWEILPSRCCFSRNKCKW